jgi:hypothetical protein
LQPRHQQSSRAAAQKRQQKKRQQHSNRSDHHFHQHNVQQEDLPQELWAQILLHVDYQQRLSACALVCRKLARAAAAATQLLDLYFGDAFERYDAFMGWTSSHGSSLTRLVLSYSPSTIQQLPCSNLLQLELADCSVQLCASSEHSGLLHSCTALTSLSLHFTEQGLLDDLAGQVPSAVPPTAVPQLKRLDVTAYVPEEPEAVLRLDQAIVLSLGSHITSLERLGLDYAEEDPGLPEPSCLLQHISSMVRLKEGLLSGAGEKHGPKQAVSVCTRLAAGSSMGRLSLS